MSEDKFEQWIKELEEGEQPVCNIENQEDCDSCGA
jgi:hypothetical protein